MTIIVCCLTGCQPVYVVLCIAFCIYLSAQHTKKRDVTVLLFSVSPCVLIKKKKNVNSTKRKAPFYSPYTMKKKKEQERRTVVESERYS